MTKDNGGPAFPKTGNFSSGQEAVYDSTDQDGMDLRDYFAAKVLASMIGSMRLGGWNIGVKGADNAGFAQASYAMADSMLAERAS